MQTVRHSPPITSRSHPKTSLIDCLGADMFILPGAVTMRREVFTRSGGFGGVWSRADETQFFWSVRRPLMTLDVAGPTARRNRRHPWDRSAGYDLSSVAVS